MSLDRESISDRLAAAGYVADRDIATAVWLMEFLKRNSALTLLPYDVYDSIKGDKSNGHVGRMRRYAVLAATQHSMNAVETFKCRAA